MVGRTKVYRPRQRGWWLRGNAIGRTQRFVRDWALDYYKLRPRNTQWQGYGEIDVARRIRDAESKLTEANALIERLQKVAQAADSYTWAEDGSPREAKALSSMREALDQLQKGDLYKEEGHK